MACLTVRVPSVHGESNVVRDERAVARERKLATLGGGKCRRQERVPALGAKEVLLVVRALSELRVVQRDEALLHDCRFAAIASWRKILVVIQVTVRLAVFLIAAHMLEELATHSAAEAFGMPAETHRIDNAAGDATAAAAARQAAALAGTCRTGGQ